MRDDMAYQAGTPLDEPGNANGAYLFPASFAQERVWFLDQFKPGSYTMPLVLRLQGRLNIAALLRSSAVLVQRHETLRTSFATVNGRLLQSVAPDLTISLPLVDLGAVEKDE